jgi:hypothetical protein
LHNVLVDKIKAESANSKFAAVNKVKKINYENVLIALDQN